MALCLNEVLLGDKLIASRFQALINYVLLSFFVGSFVPFFGGTAMDAEGFLVTFCVLRIMQD